MIDLSNFHLNLLLGGFRLGFGLVLVCGFNVCVGSRVRGW